MVLAWMITMPAAGVVGAATWWIGDVFGGYAGPIVISGLLVAGTTAIYLRSRLQPISADNVNDDWDGTPSAGRSTRHREGASA
jgi:PiT family inorganic phosphate transporter